jgi:hypothetical protein
MPVVTNASVWCLQWFSSSDREGRLYFFEENSNASSWTLPENIRPSTPSTPSTPAEKTVNNVNSNTNRQVRKTLYLKLKKINYNI